MDFYRCIFSRELFDSFTKKPVYDSDKPGIPVIPIGELYHAQESMKKNSRFQNLSVFDKVKSQIITEISGDSMESFILETSKEISLAFSKKITPKDSVNIISGLWFQEQYGSSDIILQIMESLD
jgi:hypothetical protein